MRLDFSRLELLYLRRMVQRNIIDLRRRVLKYERLGDNTYDGMFEEKKALAESELSAMCSLLSRINDEIAIRSLLAENVSGL